MFFSKFLLVIFTVILFVSCSLFEEELPLDGKYDFVVGVLTPDTLRQYQQEIFVGRIKPDNNPPQPPLGKDEVVNRVVQTARDKYWAIVTGKDDAKVFVIDEEGHRVEFTNVGDGYYRDINDELKVYPLKKYELEVQYQDKLYTSETTVPGDFEILNEIFAADTVTLFKEFSESCNCYHYPLYLKWEESKYSNLYRIEMIKGFSPILYLGHSLSSVKDNSYGTFFGALATINGEAHQQLDKTNLKIIAIDKNYTNLYRPGSNYAGTTEFYDWYDKQEDKPIKERSNISGSKNVVGCFGSYNQRRIGDFIVVPDKN